VTSAWNSQWFQQQSLLPANTQTPLFMGVGTIFRLGSKKLNNFFENCCAKSNLTIRMVMFNCKLQKKLGEQDALVAVAPQ